MASGDANYESDDEVVPQTESDPTDFVNQFMNIVANRDITDNRNTVIAQDIANQTKTGPDSKCCHVSDQLRKISENIDQQFHGPIDQCVTEAINNSVIFNEESGYDQFFKIANSLFEQGVSLGRIIALLMFGYQWIVRSLSASAGESGGIISTVIRYIVKFLSTGFIMTFVSNNGGWAALYHSLSGYASAIFVSIGLAFIFFAFMMRKNN